MPKVFIILAFCICIASDVNAGWKQFDAFYTGEGYEAKLYFNSDNLKRTKSNVKLHLGKNKYPTGNEVEELSVLTINCSNPYTDVEFHGTKWNNKKATNLLHNNGSFDLLLERVCK